MKLQKPFHAYRRTCDSHGTIKRVKEKNISLREELLEATDKQHQEMSRAIDLKEKNTYLRSRIHDVKQEACKLQDFKSKLRN